MSERREQRRIERTAGTGTVSRDGIELGAMSYALEIWQTFHIIRGLGTGPDEELLVQCGVPYKVAPPSLIPIHDRVTTSRRKVPVVGIG